MGIDLKLTPYNVSMPLGSSYFWDAPQLPSPNFYPWTTNEDGEKFPMQFICQINCQDL